MTGAPHSLRAVDALAFFVPDLQGGIGRLLVIFMSSALRWDAVLGVGQPFLVLFLGNYARDVSDDSECGTPQPVY